MSVGSQELERSTLEAKDRESLHQIATAMGGKPGSRAKKADIITMILKLAGVTDAPAGGGEPEASPPQLPLDAGGDTDAETDTDTDAAATPAPREPAASDSSVNGNGHSATSEAEHAAETDRDANESADESREAAREGGSRAPQHQARAEEGEQSSRRRRRRGRDRERQGQPGGAQGSPAPTGDDFLGEPVEVLGLLDLRDEGYGFLRVKAYLPSKEDVYVSVKQVRQFGLRKGDELKGAARPASRNEKNPALLRIDEVNGKEPELNKQRSRFEDLTALSPDERLRLDGATASTGDDGGVVDLTARFIDVVTPLGKGQRALIVSAPGAGKTEVLKHLAASLEAGHPDVTVIALLIDARPEEVTELQRSLSGEVVASTFDRPADEHLMVAELVVERAKRLVEEGRDVVVLVDGLTRLARAYNLTAPPTGRLVGGLVDAAAITPVKALVGAARKLEEGGSLTLVATAMTGTGSPADDVVVDELQGAVNLTLRLDADLAAHRKFPAVDIAASSTRHDDRLIEAGQADARRRLRAELVGAADSGGPSAAYDALATRLAGTATNDELFS